MSHFVSRRAALSGLAGTVFGCHSGSSAKPESRATASASHGAPPQAWGGLEVTRVSALREDERGGIALVLLHGYGAAGDDLASLGRSLLRPGVRCLAPAAPLSLGGGGRAWWQIDASDRPRYVSDEPGPAQLSTLPNLQLEVARSAVSGVLRTVRERYAPERVFLGGFSQGAMLALDLLLAGSEPLDRAFVLSGALLVDSAAHFAAPRASHPPVFISHGHQDRRLPFAGAERARDELQAHGYPVTFHPFEGAHAIPSEVAFALAEFLFSS